MLSWKALSLVVAAAIAMNGVVGIEQGYGGGVKLPSSTTATPDESVDQTVVTSTAGSTTDAPITTSGSSVAGSYAAIEDSSASAPSSKSDMALSTAGSAVEGSSAIDESSASAPSGKTGLDLGSANGSSDEPVFDSDIDSDAGSAVEGSNAFGESSASAPAGKTGLDLDSAAGSAVEGSSASVPVSSGSGSIYDDVSVGDVTSASASAPCDDSLSLAGSDVAASSDLDVSSASESAPCDSSISLAGGSESSDDSTPTQTEASQAASTPSSEAGSDATSTPASETGSQVEGSSDVAQGSDSATPTQSEDSVAGEASSEGTFPSTGTSCKRRLRH